MPRPADFDALDTLERELGPTLRAGLRGDAPRPDFADRLRKELAALPDQNRANHPVLIRPLARRAWAALAAVIVLGVASTLALVAVRPQPASAAEVLSQVQAETLTSLSTNAAVCTDTPGSPGAGNFGYAVARNGASANVTTGGAVQTAPDVSPSELSDRLAQALGVSGDRVRQAMLDTMRAEMPTSLPPDPMEGIAQRLGLPRQQVCAAFFDSSSGIHGIVLQHGAAGSASGQVTTRVVQIAGAPGQPNTTLDGKPVLTDANAASALDLNTATPQQLAPVAQQLGVTPERLADAVHATAAEPLPPPPTPPSEDELISHFAQNLGMSPDKVRSALTQVEGANHFYFFAVPLPKQN